MNWRRRVLLLSLVLVSGVLVLSAQAQGGKDSDRPDTVPVDGNSVGVVMDEETYSHWAAAAFGGDNDVLPVEIQVETVQEDEDCYATIDADPATAGQPLDRNSDVLRFNIRWSAKLHGFCITFGSTWAGITGHQQQITAGLEVLDPYNTPVHWQAWDETNTPSVDGALVVRYFVPSDGSGELYHFSIEIEAVDVETGEGPIRGYSAWFEQKPWLTYFPKVDRSLVAGEACTWTLTVSYGNQSKTMPFIAVTVPIESVGTFKYGTPLALEWRDARGNHATVNSVVIQSEVRENYWEYDYRPPVEFKSPTTYVGRHANDGYVYPPDTYRLAAGIEHNIVLDYYQNTTRCLRVINVIWDPP